MSIAWQREGGTEKRRGRQTRGRQMYRERDKYVVGFVFRRFLLCLRGDCDSLQPPMHLPRVEPSARLCASVYDGTQKCNES